jgi:hypothetical protein
MTLCLTRVIQLGSRFTMRNSTVILVKVNPFPHTCPSAERKETHKAANSRWCSNAMMGWVTEDLCIGSTKLIQKIREKFGNVMYVHEGIL